MTPAAPSKSLEDCKEAIELLTGQTLYIREVMVTCKQLFDSPGKRETLTTGTSDFFGLVNRAFVAEIILHFSRLFDGNDGQLNLTIPYIIGRIKQIQTCPKGAVSSLKRKQENLRLLVEEIREIRHHHVAHSSLQHALKRAPKKTTTKKRLWQCLELTEEILTELRQLELINLHPVDWSDIDDLAPGNEMFERLCRARAFDELSDGGKADDSAWEKFSSKP